MAEFLPVGASILYSWGRLLYNNWVRLYGNFCVDSKGSTEDTRHLIVLMYYSMPLDFSPILLGFISVFMYITGLFANFIFRISYEI